MRLQEQGSTDYPRGSRSLTVNGLGVHVVLEEDEDRALVLLNLLQHGESVLAARAALEQAVVRMHATLAYYAGERGSVHVPDSLARRVLGPLYPPEVEQVRDWPKVSQKGVTPPEPEALPLAPEDPRGPVEVGHPEADVVLRDSEADGRGVGAQQHG